MKHLIKYLFIVAFLESSFYLNAQVQSSASLDTGRIKIGEQVTLHLKLSFPAQDTVVFPKIGDTITEKIEVVEKSSIDTTYDRENITVKLLSQQVVLTSFDSGYWAIPPFYFTVNQDSVATDPLLLEVNAVQVDTSQAIKDIKNPIQVPFSLKEWLKNHWKWIAAGVLLLGIIAFLIYRIYRKKQTPKTIPVPIEPAKPAHMIAFEKLDKLKEKKLWQKGKVKAFYSELSEILREYIENRYPVNALELTTEEILHNMRGLDIKKEDKEKLIQVLMLADLVKFAKERPLGSENEQRFNNAVSFIEATKIEKKEEVSGETENKENNA